MGYLGSWAIDDALTLTVQTLGPGPVDADSAPVYRIYKANTTVPILTGSFSLLDGANTDGFYSAQIVLSAANGFVSGAQYSVLKRAVIGGISGVEPETFQIRAPVRDSPVRRHLSHLWWVFQDHIASLIPVRGRRP